MNNLFEHFLNSYLDGEKFDNKEKEYHKILCSQLPKYIGNLLNDQYIIKGSCGASNKADIPWIGIFNENITRTAQYGIYVVYLFRKDMSGFYLCLGQGITNFDKFGNNKYNLMDKVAKYFKEKTDNDYFDKNEIDLGCNSKKGKEYKRVNILSKYYDKDNISKYNFEKDLLELAKIYEEIYYSMGSLSYDDIIENLLSKSEEDLVLLEEAKNEIYNTLLTEAGDEEAEVVELTQIDVPSVVKNGYFGISKKRIKKTDYVKKAKKDAEIGLKGEQLVLENEKAKMIEHGRNDLLVNIKWVSEYDDSLGYDIESFDFDSDGKEKQIYIEVKTTESNEKNVFFVSKNEVERMNDLKDKYWIYRVCNIKKKAEFYRINGLQFYNVFNLVEKTYTAEFK